MVGFLVLVYPATLLLVAMLSGVLMGSHPLLLQSMWFE